MGKSLNEILKQGVVFDEEILRAAEKGKLIFFLGAGVSRIMGVSGWDSFSENLIRVAFPEYKEQAVLLRDIKDSKERITVAYKKFEEDGNLDGFYKQFGKSLEPDRTVFDSKRNIYQILSRFNATFLTTNADNLFEEILGSASCTEECNAAIVTNEHLKRYSRLFYLHGHYREDVDVEKNNLVFTAPQYVARYNNDVFEEFLKAIFRENNVIIFIGYGLNEFELMDYIVTKAGHSAESPQKVYVLYGFCENEEILYRAKKSYFEALNINLIPYNMSTKGYDTLIDVLQFLYEDYEKRTILPTAEIISKAVSDFCDENYARIIRYLKDDELARVTESEIVREIRKNNSYEWVNGFYKDSLFSCQQMDKKLNTRAWPLLELLVDWVKSDCVEAQDAAVGFLNQIKEEQAKKLSEHYTYINKYIIEIILSLDKKHIDSKYLGLMGVIVAENNLFYYELQNIKNMKRITQWSLKNIGQLFDFVLGKVDFHSYHDNQSYVIEKFFKKFNATISNERIAKWIFGYFVKIIKRAINKDFVLFIHIRDLDNIYKNHQDYWKLILSEIKYSFSKLGERKQYIFIDKLMHDSTDACWKLALYLARKHNHNIASLILDNKDVFSSYTCYHELYLLLKHHKENGYLLEAMQVVLCERICDAQFGIDKYDKKSKDDYYENLILSKRLSLLQVLSCEDARQATLYILEKNIEPYPNEVVAEQCDYVHSAKWGNEIQLSKEDFKKIPVEQWCKKFEEVCGTITEYFELSDCARQFINMVTEGTEGEINTIIPMIKSLSYPLQKVVMEAIRAKRDDFVSYSLLINVSLDILEQIIDKEANKELAKTIFMLLSDIKMVEEIDVKRTLRVIDPWLHVSLGDADTFSGEKNLLNNLINYGDFAKFSVLLNCYVSLKKNTGHVLSDNEISRLLRILDTDNYKNIYRYTLCYYFQNLKYISQSKSISFCEALLNDEVFNMTSLMLCVLNSNHVFPELVDAIRNKFILGKYSIPDECEDRILTNNFYEYIIASCYYGLLTIEELRKVYESFEFVDYFLHTISSWSRKENFVLEDWLIPCWESVKNIHRGKEEKCAVVLLHSINDVEKPTERLLDVYIEATSFCGRCSYIYAKISKALVFCDVNVDKGLKLGEVLIENNDFVDDDDLILFTQKCAEMDRKDTARILLNKLSDSGKISISKKEQIGELLK